MSPTLTCVALALMGVDLGYRPASNGGTDFIIHVSPATLQASRPGDLIELDVQRVAQEKRPSHFTITPFNEKLPGEVSVAALLPPATAPIGQAEPGAAGGGHFTRSGVVRAARRSTGEYSTAKFASVRADGCTARFAGERDHSGIQIRGHCASQFQWRQLGPIGAGRGTDRDADELNLGGIQIWEPAVRQPQR